MQTCRALLRVVASLRLRYVRGAIAPRPCVTDIGLGQKENAVIARARAITAAVVVTGTVTDGLFDSWTSAIPKVNDHRRAHATSYCETLAVSGSSVAVRPRKRIRPYPLD